MLHSMENMENMKLPGQIKTTVLTYGEAVPSETAKQYINSSGERVCLHTTAICKKCGTEVEYQRMWHEVPQRLWKFQEYGDSTSYA